MSVSLTLHGDRYITTELPALIMGVLNATPDSFWEGSRSVSVNEGIERALVMQGEGADIIDIGGESTRPGSRYVSIDEELERIIPVIEGIRRESRIPISVDTRKSAVMEAAFAAGADMVNDISALTDDPDLAALAARTGMTVILMHKQGVPATMQVNPTYTDVVSEVRGYLLERAAEAQKAGIPKDRIILDPGIGFGKRHEDNCALIAGLAEIANGGYPVLMALSRKSCIGTMTGRDTQDRLSGTLAANMLAVQNGAKVLRVHDVAQTRDMLMVLQEISTRGIH